MKKRTARAFGVFGLIIFGALIVIGSLLRAWEMVGASAILGGLVVYEMRK